MSIFQAAENNRKSNEGKFISYQDWLESNDNSEVGYAEIVRPGRSENEIKGFDEYKKIKNRQRKAYNFFIEKVAEMKSENIIHEVDSLNSLAGRVERLENTVNQSDYEDVFSGDKNIEIITGKLSTIILETEWYYDIDTLEDDSYWPYISDSLKKDDLIWAWVDFLLLERLKEELPKDAGNPKLTDYEKEWFKNLISDINELMTNEEINSYLKNKVSDFTPNPGANYFWGDGYNKSEFGRVFQQLYKLKFGKDFKDSSFRKNEIMENLE